MRMKMYDTDKGITIQFGRDFDLVTEDTGDAFALTLVGGFVVFLLLII